MYPYTTIPPASQCLLQLDTNMTRQDYLKPQLCLHRIDGILKGFAQMIQQIKYRFRQKQNYSGIFQMFWMMTLSRAKWTRSIL
jgi:hypothetical protein